MKVEAGHLRVPYFYDDILSGRVIVPSYQREYCWSDEQKLLFVDSVLKSIPVGVIQLRKFFQNFQERYEVVDGLHRIRTIFMILKGDGFFYNVENDTFTLNPQDFDYSQKMKNNELGYGIEIPNDDENWTKSRAFNKSYEKFRHLELLHFTFSGTDEEVKTAFDRINQEGIAFTPTFRQVANSTLLTI